MDTHTIELPGRRADQDLPFVENVFRRSGGRGMAWPAKFLVGLRQFLGLVFALDKEKTGKLPPEGSYYWHMTDAEIEECLRTPGQSQGPTRLLWNDQESAVVEILNQTCQAFAVTWIEGEQGHLAVLVIETKWWSKYYLALIEPFRKYIVYPAMLTWAEKTWRDFDSSLN